MPNIKSAAKRMRTSEKNRQRNRAVKSELNTTRRHVLASVNRGEKEKSREMFNAFTAALDKAVKKGVITSNKADRSKSRIALRLNALG